MEALFSDIVFMESRSDVDSLKRPRLGDRFNCLNKLPLLSVSACDITVPAPDGWSMYGPHVIMPLCCVAVITVYSN